MKTNYKIISAVTLALMGSTVFANCSLDEVKDGWTGSLRFKCDKDTDLLKNPINFEISNGVQIGSLWGLPGKSNIIKSGNKASVTVEKWWPQGTGYVLPAGKSVIVSFSPTNVTTYDANYAPDFEIRNFSVGGESQEQQAGSVTIKLPEKPDFITDQSLPDVIILNSNGVKVAELIDKQWGASIDQELLAGNYTISIPAINGATGNASPAAITVDANSTQSVDINYDTPAPAEEGSIELSANVDTASTQKLPYTINGVDNNFSQQGTVGFNNPITINNLPATERGTKYTISVNSDLQQDGNIYKAEPITVTVTKFNTSKVALKFIKQEVQTQQIAISVAGLPNQQTSTLTLANDKGDKHEVTMDKNGDFNLNIPQDGDTWTITVASINGYNIITSPSTFSANQDSQSVSVAFEQRAPIEAGKKVVGYWANWKGAMQAPTAANNTQSAYYSNDVAPYTHVMYSFLTLAKSPNPDTPANTSWDGSAIYESMTANDVLSVMKQYPAGTANWERSDNWMRSRIDGLVKATHENSSKFIWAIGGWSDLQQTIKKNQIDKFVSMVVDLLKVSGDGVDFDWEHLNQLANGQANPNATEQKEILAETMLKLRQALDAAGMKDKEIGYTTRFNAFMADSKQYGFPGFQSDGEGLAIDDWLKTHGSSLNKVINNVNIMAYDVGPSYMPNGKTWNMSVYKDVLSTFSSRVDPKLVVLGFEPGYQAAGGVWEGMPTSKEAINYLADNNYGGSMFWAINLPNPAVDGSLLGLNSDILADFSRDKFEIE